MKTEEEIREADKRELEIELKKRAADNAAYLKFNKATKEEWDKYTSIWYPAKAEWEAFQEPLKKKLLAQLVINTLTEEDALAEVRSNWQECPKCGTLAARYQVFCTDDKCPVNLLTAKKKDAKVK